MSDVTKRGRCGGMWQVVQYNSGIYSCALFIICAIWLSFPYVKPVTARMVVAGIAVSSLFWLCSSLLVSHYVYDCSSLYDLDWVRRDLSKMPQRWINVHAGVDETSLRLAQLFPTAVGEILDIHDPQEMTEASIRRARRTRRSLMRFTPANWNALPIADDTIDAAFLFFAAHELRRDEARTQLFRELARVLKSDGELGVIEHLRGCANFLAFGPGFLHFFSRSSWLRTAAAAGLQVRTEKSITPFVRVFVFRRAI
jgi:SAM-dependent methyltransferase